MKLLVCSYYVFLPNPSLPIHGDSKTCEAAEEQRVELSSVSG